MAFNKNKKIVTTALTAAMVASAVAPVAAAKLTPAQDATKAVDGYYKLSVKTKADVSNSAKVKKAALAKVAKLTSKKDAKLKASLTAKVAKKSAAINKYYQTVIVAAETEAKAIAAVEAALKLGAETPITETTTKEQVEALYTQVIGLIGKVKNEAKKAEFKTAADKLKADALAKIESLATPKVASVTAINAKQIQVVFNKAVDEDTVYDLANYKFKLNGAAEATVASVDANADVTVQEDGKTVVITTTTTLEAEFGVTQTGTPFNFKVSGVKAANGVTFPTTTLAVSVKDAVAPELVSGSAKASVSTKKVTLTFSEPVDFATTGVFKVNGKVVTPSAGATPNQVVLTTTDNLLAGQSYAVEVLNLKDYAGNLLKVNPSSLNVTVTPDAAIANIVSVTTLEDDKVKVVFDKSMNTATLTSSTVAVLNANGAATGAYSVNAVAGSANKEFTIDFTGGLYSNSNTENLSIVFTNAIKDSSGNAIAAVTKTATVTKDTDAPTVASTSVLAKAAVYDGVTYNNGALVVTFNEKVKDPGTTILTGSSIKLIDQDGTDITSLVTLGNPVLNSRDSKVLVIPFSANTITSASKTATVILSSGITTDASLGNNSSVAATFNAVNLQATLSDVTLPVVSNVGNSSNDITFTVTEANLDKSTVQNVDNYRLDGKPLPSGSYVTISTSGSTHSVTIKLPVGSVDSTRATYAFTVNGIKDLAGNTADVLAVNNLSLTDDVKPVLTTGKLNADGTVTVGFSEGVTGTVTGDLVVTLNGKALAASAVTPTDVTTGADAGGSLLTLGTSYDAGTAAAGDEIIYVNVAGGTAGYDAGTDLVIATGTFANLAAYGTSVKAADVLTLKVATAAAGTLTGADATGNKLANGKSVVVK